MRRVSDVRTAASGVKSGAISFDLFALQTKEQWRVFAADIMRKWPQPAWVELEDVEQDLLVGAWKAIQSHQAGRSDLGGYVVWNAFDKAKKRAHKARNAYRHRGADSSPSRIERPTGLLSTESDSPTEQAIVRAVEKATSIEATQEETLLFEEIYEALVKVCNARQALAIEALVAFDGDEVAAAAFLYEDECARFRYRLQTEEQARTFVRQRRHEVYEMLLAS